MISNSTAGEALRSMRVPYFFWISWMSASSFAVAIRASLGVKEWDSDSVFLLPLPADERCLFAFDQRDATMYHAVVAVAVGKEIIPNQQPAFAGLDVFVERPEMGAPAFLRRRQVNKEG